MPIEVVETAFRTQIDQRLRRPSSRVSVATPFMSFRIAQWLATVPAARRGDRRLMAAWDARSIDDLYLSYGLDGGNVEIGTLLTRSASLDVRTAFDRWRNSADPLDERAIRSGMKRQATAARDRGERLDGEAQPGYRPRPPAVPVPMVLPPGRVPAPAATARAIAHYWHGDTIARSLASAGRRHDEFTSRAQMAKHLVAGTRVYTVGCAPMGA